MKSRLETTSQRSTEAKERKGDLSRIDERFYQSGSVHTMANMKGKKVINKPPYNSSRPEMDTESPRQPVFPAIFSP